MTRRVAASENTAEIGLGYGFSRHGKAAALIVTDMMNHEVAAEIL